MAEVTTQARVGWSDTDAGGHHHHASVARFVEEAEAELYRRIGDPQLMKIVPRVEYHAEYRRRLYYQDLMDVTLRVAAVGRTSLTYTFEVRRADDGSVASRGGYVVVHIDEVTGKSEPWPEHLRKALLGD
ncbi:MAG TPA: thioesterase family protein [Micromonosporaceae bacterium]|jgi:YbgC/YbaW family acyl-CoA thioester hydrolase